MEENKKLAEGNQENVYTITFDMLNDKQVFLMPYVGQKVGALFNENFDVIPKDFAHDQHDFDWSVYYNIYGNESTIEFKYSNGLILPSHNYIGEGLEVLCGMEFVVYTINERPTDNNFMSVFGNALCASDPITLKKENFTILENVFGEFEPDYIQKFKITFDLLNHKCIFLMPYVGQEVGEKFSKRFQLLSNAISKENFDWTKHYTIYQHGDVAVFTDKGLRVPGIKNKYTIPIGDKVAVYVMSKMPNLSGIEYYDIINNAWYVSHPFELKKMDIVVYEDNWSTFEHYYEDPR